MKLILILACLALFVVVTQGQSTCRGHVRRDLQNCVGEGNSGSGGRRRHCRRNSNNNMWYYSQRSQSCRRMSYRGCGGNRNRYCSLAACQSKCIPPVVTRPTTIDPTTSADPSTTSDAPAPSVEADPSVEPATTAES